MGIILYNILIAKIEAYGLDYNSQTFTLDYLTSRKRRTKKGTSQNKAFRGISQGSILGQLLFKSLSMKKLISEVWKY